MKRLRILMVFTVLLLAVLSLTSSPQSLLRAAANPSPDFCSTCESNCYADAWGFPNGEYNRCRNNGGSISTCSTSARNSYNSCIALCNYAGCSIPYMPSGGGSGGSCGLTFNGGGTNSCECDPNDPTCTSPIIRDTAGNGIHLTSAADGVDFDIRGSGTTIRIAWTQAGSDDAFLTLDRNGNGTIDNGTELFGNYSPQPEGPDQNGFLALAEYDKAVNGGDGDGFITSADDIFDDLQLWKDVNHNGISEESELSPLPATWSIPLTYNETRRRDRYGNVFRYHAGEWWDVFFTIIPPQ